MCTMILIINMVPGYPLVLAANRDEFMDRGFSPPHLWPVDVFEPRIFAGKDEKEGGTWLGISKHGIVTGIVNRYTGHRDPGKRSRGKIVLDCLRNKSLQGIELFLKREDLTRYNPFTLFCYEKGEALISTNYHEKQMYPMAKGLYVITNCDPEDETDEKRIYLKTRLDMIPNEPGRLRDMLISACADHGGPQHFPYPVCVHLEGYGTVSSSILMLGERLHSSHYYYCEGPPCNGDYRDLTPTFASLFC